jgi:dTDP-glucose 4,6-dehydratase
MTPNLSATDLEEILDSTDSIHRSLDRSRVLITGGTGFFGRWLLESWAYASDRLSLDRTAIVVSRDPERFRADAPHLGHHRSIEFVAGDVLGPPPVAGTFDAAIHAATAASLALSRSSPRLMFDTIVNGTANVLEWLGPSGSVDMLFTSSGAVYGTQDPAVELVTEACMTGPDATSPTAVYAEAKRAAEMLCAIESTTGVRCRIARCFAFVGPHLPLDAHFAIGNFIRDGLAGSDIVIEGDGTPRRSYLYSSDLTAWLWTILRNGAPARPYNVGSDDGRDLRSFAEIVSRQCPGRRVVVRETPQPGQPPARYVPDITRASNELGLGVNVQIETAIQRTLDWHRLRR